MVQKLFKIIFHKKISFQFQKVSPLETKKAKAKQFDKLSGSSYLSLRSLCNLQQALLEIVYFWHSNGNVQLIRDTRNTSDFHAGT